MGGPAWAELFDWRPHQLAVLPPLLLHQQISNLGPLQHCSPVLSTLARAFMCMLQASAMMDCSAWRRRGGWTCWWARWTAWRPRTWVRQQDRIAAMMH